MSFMNQISIAKINQISKQVSDNASSLAAIASQAISVKVSPYNAKGDCVVDGSGNYVSGTDDTTAIQNAVNAGSLIIFPSGIYFVNSINVPSNTTLLAYGNVTLISKANNAIIFNCSNASGIVISGFNFNHQASTRGDGIRFTTCTDSKVLNCNATGCDMGFRLTQTCARITLENCKAQQSVESGFLFNMCTDCSVINGIANNNGSTSLHHGFYISDLTSTRVKIVSCTGYSNAGAGVQFEGTNHEINGGSFYQNTTNGINNKPNSWARILGSLCLSNTREGIFLDTADYCGIYNVNCSNNGLNGLHLKNSHYIGVNGGKFNQNVNNGIFLNATVTGEVLRECTITGVVCIDNDNNDTSTYDGIHIDGQAVRNVIDGCVCRTTTGTTKQRYGINVANASSTKNIISNCQLYGNKTGALNDLGTSSTSNNMTT